MKKIRYSQQSFIIILTLLSAPANAAGTVSPFSVAENERCTGHVVWHCERSTKGIDENYGCFQTELDKCLRTPQYNPG